MKSIKKMLGLIMAATMMVSLCFTGSVKAASAPKAPGKVTTKTGVYYDYLKKHPEVMPGNCYSCKISWSKVKGADGYVVKIKWDSDGIKSTKKVTVTKKGSKYKVSSNGIMIGKSAKNLVDGSTNSKITTSKLSFVVSGGSCEYAEKVSVKSFKIVNGKKVYSKAKSKKVK